MIFDRIYRDNLWGAGESRSGPGSGSSATERISAYILDLVAELGVSSVLDVGCGDGYWMPDLPGYYGYDASRVALGLARQRHPDRQYSPVLPLRPFDLVICRDVIQHLPLAEGTNLLAAIRATGSGALLASTFRGGQNVDIAAGDAYSPDLTAPPFDMATPELLLFDGYGYAGSDDVRDPRKHLGLWRL